MGVQEKLKGISLEGSKIIGVIYDYETMTLEMEFALEADHPKYDATTETASRSGFIMFADIGHLSLKPGSQKADTDRYDISAAETGEDYFFIQSEWGEIELTAQSIRIAVD